MKTRSFFALAVAGLAAAMLSLAAQAAYVWNVDGAAPLRVDVDTAEARAAEVSGPVDDFVPLPDGGAWLRRGGELVRLAPDLGVAARASAKKRRTVSGSSPCRCPAVITVRRVAVSRSGS